MDTKIIVIKVMNNLWWKETFLKVLPEKKITTVVAIEAGCK